MAARYVLVALAAVFLLAAAVRRTDRGPTAQSRTWLLVGAIFAAVSLWLFSRS